MELFSTEPEGLMLSKEMSYNFLKIFNYTLQFALLFIRPWRLQRPFHHLVYNIYVKYASYSCHSFSFSANSFDECSDKEEQVMDLSIIFDLLHFKDPFASVYHIQCI